MDIAQYISDLLREHDEVGLPGIGTFFKRSVSASFNKAEGIYYPPSDIIDIRQDDGSSSVLIDHIIQSKHISESSALYFIERFCENISKNLDKNSSVNISPLGVLTKTENGYNLKSDSTSFGANFFGLKPIKEPDVHKNIPSIKPQDEIITEEKNEETTSSGSKAPWIILAIILLLGAAFGITYFYYPQFFKNLKLSPNKKPHTNVVKPVAVPKITDSVSFADSLVRELEQQGMNAEVEKAPDTLKISSNITQPDSLKVKPRPGKEFEIIVASFGLKREAEASVKALRKKGIDAKVIEDTKKPKYKVSIGTFTSMSTANKEKKRIQQELSKDAWILTITHKEN